MEITKERALYLMKIELECVKCDSCDRECGNCNLAQDRDELIAAFQKVIAELS